MRSSPSRSSWRPCWTPRPSACGANASYTAGSEPAVQHDRISPRISVAHVVAGVAARILLQVILVVRLRRGPAAGVDDLGDDRVLPAPRLRGPRLDLFGDLALR